MNVLPFAAATFLLTAALLSGCTSETHATPIPGSTTAARTPSPTGVPRLLPARPRDIDLAGVDPCQALTVEQAKQLDYDKGYQRKPTPSTDIITGTADCNYSSRVRGLGVLISPVTSEGAETWLTSPERKTNEPPKQVIVDGFPALQITVLPNDSRPNKCELIVDVHDGQYLSIFSSDLDGGPSGSGAYCAEDKRVAGMVIQTIESGK